MVKNTVFKEDLSSICGGETCPPSDARAPELQEVTRLIANDPPTPNDFLSYYALGKPKPHDVDMCRWASCSVFEGVPAIAKLPRIKKRFKHIAYIEIDENSGLIKPGNGGHIDLWPFADFDPIKAVRGCAPL